MLRRKKLWGGIALCLMFSLWKIYQSLRMGSSASLFPLGGWTGAKSLSEAKPCGCDSCIQELRHSTWFREHFDVAVDPLLTLQNPEIPPEVLQWWLKLQSRQTGTQLQETIRHLFAILPSPTARVLDTAQCRTCAVVGNSGRLRNTQHGREIDSHDYVLRMNRAQTTGFEKDVGVRTTHHFMYPESAVNLQSGIHLVLVPFKPLDLKWVTSAFSTWELQFTYKRVKRLIEADKSKVLILNPSFLKYIQDKWTQHHGKYPSTGFIALIFALHMCNKVSAFGYGADSNGNWHHYWEENRYSGAFRRTGVHNADYELSLIKRLAAEGKISFYM
uniref:CMP-N-acetylneuraminate-beta-galactosamide-alpha-2,3-sialyltransferase 2 n=1 Tax=Sphenodon punctatus TaxID=8508 RepID=A0A8D0GYF5_SPHPU